MTHRLQHHAVLRSWLWMPATRLTPHPSIHQHGADITIVDLEDGVPNTQKQAARQQVQRCWTACNDGAWGLRINALRTLEGLADVQFLSDSQLRPDVLVVPNVRSADELSILNDLLNRTPGADPIPLLPVLETPEAYQDRYRLAAVENSLGMVFGSADFAASLGISPDAASLDRVRHDMVLATKVAGGLAIDAPCFKLRDPSLLRQRCEASYRMGMDGMAAIHPDQLPTIHAAYSPSEQDVAAARSLLEASSTLQHKGVMLQRDRVVGPPMVRAAQHTLERHTLINRKEVL